MALSACRSPRLMKNESLPTCASKNVICSIRDDRRLKRYDKNARLKRGHELAEMNECR
jgi:hypothetical protein